MNLRGVTYIFPGEGTRSDVIVLTSTAASRKPCTRKTVFSFVRVPCARPEPVLASALVGLVLSLSYTVLASALVVQIRNNSALQKGIF